MIDCLYVGVGGFIGSVARYLIGLLPFAFENGFPIKTFAINIIGALLIGMIAAYAAKNPNFDSRMVLFIKVGICGGFTTFSTFALEIGGLLEKGIITTALLYAVLSTLLGVLAFYFGQSIINGQY